MKIPKSSIVLSLFMFIFISVNFAQHKRVSVATSDVCKKSASVENTGTPSHENKVPTVVVKVWGADYDQPGISYDDDLGNSGARPLQHLDALDPDVAFICNGTNFYVVVAYYSTGCSSFIAEYYEWISNTLVLSGTPVVLLENENNHSYVKVYGNYNGEFEIVWDMDSQDKGTAKRITGGIDPVTGKPVVKQSVQKVNYLINFNYE